MIETTNDQRHVLVSANWHQARWNREDGWRWAKCCLLKHADYELFGAMARLIGTPQRAERWPRRRLLARWHE